MTLPRLTWASAIVLSPLLCAVVSASAGPNARPDLDAWAAQGAAYAPLCDAFARNVSLAVPADDRVLVEADIEALLRILWTYPGIPPAAQALYVAFLHEGLPEAPERDARIDGTCPVALAYRGGMGAIIKSLAQIPASDSLRRRVVRLALYKAHVDLLAPAPILDVMVHATLLNDMASAGILPRWSVAAARAAYEKAEAQRIAVNEAARGAQAPLTEELRAAEVARSSLMAFVSQLDGAAPQRDASATGPGFP